MDAVVDTDTMVDTETMADTDTVADTIPWRIQILWRIPRRVPSAQKKLAADIRLPLGIWMSAGIRIRHGYPDFRIR